MLTATTRRDKSAPVAKMVVIFDAGDPPPAPATFGRGILPATRWTGQHAYAPFTVDELEWAESVFLADRAAELEAEEDAYHEMLDALALEDAMLQRYTRGHVL
jgi:hypothetical protein